MKDLEMKCEVLTLELSVLRNYGLKRTEKYEEIINSLQKKKEGNSVYIIEKDDGDSWQPVQVTKSGKGFYESMEEAIYWAERSIHDELGNDWRIIEYKGENS